MKSFLIRAAILATFIPVVAAAANAAVRNQEFVRVNANGQITLYTSGYDNGGSGFMVRKQVGNYVIWFENRADFCVGTATIHDIPGEIRVDQIGSVFSKNVYTFTSNGVPADRAFSLLLTC